MGWMAPCRCQGWVANNANGRAPWIVRLLQTKPRMVVPDALANNMARIAWAVMARRRLPPRAHAPRLWPAPGPGSKSKRPCRSTPTSLSPRRGMRMSPADRQGGADLAGQCDTDPEGLIRDPHLTVPTGASGQGAAPQKPAPAKAGGRTHDCKRLRPSTAVSLCEPGAIHTCPAHPRLFLRGAPGHGWLPHARPRQDERAGSALCAAGKIFPGQTCACAGMTEQRRAWSARQILHTCEGGRQVDSPRPSDASNSAARALLRGRFRGRDDTWKGMISSSMIHLAGQYLVLAQFVKCHVADPSRARLHSPTAWWLADARESGADLLRSARLLAGPV